MSEIRVLICRRPGGAFGYISDGWMNALNDSGIIARRWDGHEKSWRRFNPHLYAGCTGHRQDIPAKRGKCKVVLHCNPNCTYKIEPSINEPESAIQWALGHKPDAVFGYGFEKDRKHWAGWDKAGTKWVPMATAGDATFYGPEHGNHGQAEIVYLGGRWKYKAKNIDQYLLPVLRSAMKCLVRGWGDWPDGLCGGEMSNDLVPRFLASGKIGPCVSEPHTTKWGIDLPERIWKVALSGTIVVHDKVPGLRTVVPGFLMASNPAEYINIIDKVLGWDNVKRASFAKMQYNTVIKQHTYHHRLAGLFGAIGMNDARDRVQNRISLPIYQWESRCA